MAIFIKGYPPRIFEIGQPYPHRIRETQKYIRNGYSPVSATGIRNDFPPAEGMSFRTPSDTPNSEASTQSEREFESRLFPHMAAGPVEICGVKIDSSPGAGQATNGRELTIIRGQS